MSRIGIDFDNTIACYDQAFYDVAVIMDMGTDSVEASKIDIKNLVLQRSGGELDWQRLQGQVYGKHMLRAEMFSGFLEFLYMSRLRGNEIFIVSHKSEFGHFDEDRVPLREQALNWMQANGVFDENCFGLKRQDVFFETTREDKIARIAALNCTHFIDDLSEVFEEPSFPEGVIKFLFRPGTEVCQSSMTISVNSWRELNQRLNSEWTESEVREVIVKKFPQLNVEGVALKKGRGNSRVYQLFAKANASYALKIYPDRQLDSRPRLETEFLACQQLSDRGYPVAEAVAIDKNLGWGIYRWISASPIEVADTRFVSDAAKFMGGLYGDKQMARNFGRFDLASEACLSGAQIVRQIQSRMKNLKAVEAGELRDFFGKEFSVVFAAAVEHAKQELGALFDTDLDIELRILSPSDFGSHNALRGAEGSSVFIDFEYFGWDDPVKLAADFYWHPGMRLSAVLRQRWIDCCLEIFKKDLLFHKRLSSYLPLYGLRWCMILLNEFLSLGSARRLHAAPDKAGELATIRNEQLSKSKMLLQEIKEIIHDHGSTIQVS